MYSVNCQLAVSPAITRASSVSLDAPPHGSVCFVSPPSLVIQVTSAETLFAAHSASPNSWEASRHRELESLHPLHTLPCVLVAETWEVSIGTPYLRRRLETQTNTPCALHKGALIAEGGRRELSYK